MNLPGSRHRLPLVLPLAVVSAAVFSSPLFGQVYPPFRPPVAGGQFGGRPGFGPSVPGGMFGQPPGFNSNPAGGILGRTPGFNPNPGGGILGRTPGFNPPSSPFTESVWKCSRCGAVLGRGPVKPTMPFCPSCSARFANGLTPEVAGPGGRMPMPTFTPPPTPPNGFPTTPAGPTPPVANQAPPATPAPPPLATEVPPAQPLVNPNPAPVTLPTPTTAPVPAASDSFDSAQPAAGSAKLAVAVGIVVFGVLVLVGAALLVLSSQKGSSTPSRRRRRQMDDEDDYIDD